VALYIPYRDISNLEPGDHVCHFHRGDEESLNLVARFVAAGLESGQQSVVVAPADRLARIGGEIAAQAGVDMEAAGEAVRLHSVGEVIGRAGAPQAGRVAAVLREEVEAARAKGFKTLRVWAHMDLAAAALASPKALIRYEATLDELVRESAAIHVCSYDRRNTDSGLVFDILCAHPKAMVDGLVYDNFYYKRFVETARDGGDARLDHWLSSLVESAGHAARTASHLELEQALAEVSRLLLVASPEAFENALAILGTAVGADHSYIFFFRDNRTRMDNTYEWCAPGIPPQKELLQDLESADFPWWMEKLSNGENIVIGDLDRLDAPAEKAILKAQGIKSLLVVPIYSEENELIAFMGFDDTRRTRTWHPEEVRLLRMAAEIVAAHVGRTRTQARYRALAEAASDIIFTLRPDGVITYLNPAFEAVTGLPREEWTGKTFDGLLPPHEREGVLEAFRENVDDLQPMPATSGIITKSGEERTIETSVTKLIEGGKFYGLCGISRDITERVRTENALRESLQTSADIVQAMPSGMLIYRFEEPDRLYLVEGNPQAEEISGIALERARGREFNEIWPGAKSAGLSEAFLEVMRTGKIYSTENVRYHDGRIQGNFRVRAFRMPGSRLGVMFEDVSELERTRHALLSMQADYHAVFNAVNDAVLVHDIEDGRIIDANNTAGQLYGRPPDELKGMTVGQISAGEPPYTNAQALTWIRKALTEGPQLFEWHARRKDGSLFWEEVNLKKAVVRGVERLIAVVRDITERRRAEALLRESEANYHAIFDAVNDAIFVHDIETGAVVDVNSKMCEMYECTPEQARGFTVRDFSQGEPPYSADDARRWMKKTLEEGPQLFEWLAKTAGGRLFWTEVNLKSAVIGGRTRILAVVRDIDERKRLEEQLLHTQKVEALGRVVGGVAHDFNNVLASISGYSELALSKLDSDEPAAGDVESIRNVALSAGLLTRRLLTFSRKKPRTRQDLNLNDLIQDISVMLKPVIGPQIKMVKTLDPDLPATSADPGGLEQVIVNLAINACDAMNDGGTLTIETAYVRSGSAETPPRRHLEDGPYVRLSVRDTGAGMDPETLEHAFEPFFTTKEVGEGTGLGLSTVHAIVKQSGGEVFLESAPGEGTVCTVYLPARRLAAPAPPEVPAAPAVGGTVLIVDDNETLREFAAEVLRRNGYAVITAPDGRQALSALENNGEGVDLVITDVVMPRIDGRRLVHEIRKSNPRTRILLTSGYAEGWTGQDEIDVLEKPFSAQTLLSKVAAVLTR